MVSPPRVVLTGARGFIGSRILSLLAAQGFEVHAVGRSNVAGTTSHRLDLLTDDPAPTLAAIRPTHLVHLAWDEDRTEMWNGLSNLAWVAATLRLVLAFRAAGGTRAVIAGSVAEYEWTQARLDEAATPINPATGYGVARQALFELLTRTPTLAPFSLGWARIFFVFGPHDKPERLLSQVIDGVAAGRAVDCSQGTQVRPFIHVDDVAGALAALLSSPVEGAVNVALAETMSVRDLALCAATAAGDPNLVRFGTRPLQAGEPPVLEASVARLTDEVGYVPRYTIASGVAATVAERLAR